MAILKTISIVIIFDRFFLYLLILQEI